MSRVALCAFIALVATIAKAQEDSFEIEPPILPQNLKDDAALLKSDAPAPILDVAKLEKDLERARKNAASAERLYKIGALAKVEAEARILKAIRLESDLENARLAQAKEQALSRNPNETKEPGGNETAKADDEPAAVASSTEAALAHAIEAAHAAAAKREQAEIEAAEINVRRQQKLVALGSARKSDVARAEQKLAELRAKIQ